MDIQQILFTEESTQALQLMYIYCNTANVIGGVGEGGMYLGGGIFGGANAMRCRMMTAMVLGK